MTQGGDGKASKRITTFTILTTMWTDISMDFIVGLPKFRKQIMIMVVVDHLSKYAHFCALQHPFKASIVAQVFMDNIFKLHGMPKSIVTDHDPTFTSNLWQGVVLASRYPIESQHNISPPNRWSDEEAVNKCLEAYLRCFSLNRQAQWVQWLPLAEWWYNTTYHGATKMTPFEAVYGKSPLGDLLLTRLI
jgi:hypothetical protein